MRAFGAQQASRERRATVGGACNAGMRVPAVFKRRVCLLPVVLFICIISTAEAASSWNGGYRTIALQDAVIGQSSPAALWYPTAAAPAPLFMTSSLSRCRLPAIVCRGIAFEMPVAQNAPVGAGAFGVIVVSHGAGGMALLVEGGRCCGRAPALNASSLRARASADQSSRCHSGR